MEKPKHMHHKEQVIKQPISSFLNEEIKEDIQKCIETNNNET